MARTEPPGRHLTSTGSPSVVDALRRSPQGCPIFPPRRAGLSLVEWTVLASRPLRPTKEPLCEINDNRRNAAASSVYSQPLSVQAVSEPPGRRLPAPGSHTRRRRASPQEPFGSSGGVGLSATLAASRLISFVLTESQAVMWATCNASIGYRPCTVTASLGMLATPDLFWLGQSLPAATAPAPGSHTSTSVQLALCTGVRRLMRIAPRPFPCQVGRTL